MKLKPLSDRVIIKQDQAEQTTASGLYIAGDTKEKPQTGEVISVGPGRIGKDGKLMDMPVKKGDRVLYNKYAGNEVLCGDEEVLIIRAEDIYAIIG